MSKAIVEEQTERLRQLVIAARETSTVGPQANECLDQLRALYDRNPRLFSVEDVRWLNVLRGYLALRLASHGPRGGPYAPKSKRKGDALDHCWRCETRLDERFTEICPTCDSKAYHWMICPVCGACGCQRSGKVLV